MYRHVLLGACCIAPIVFALPSIAQTNVQPSPDVTRMPITGLTCADIVNLPPGHQGALIYYAAGYVDGASESASSAAATSSASSAVADNTQSGTNGDNGQVAGLGLEAGDVMQACLAQTTALLVDVIKEAGGKAGLTAATSSAAKSSSEMEASSRPSGSSTASGPVSSSPSADGTSSGGSSSETAGSSSTSQ